MTDLLDIFNADSRKSVSKFSGLMWFLLFFYLMWYLIASWILLSENTHPLIPPPDIDILATSSSGDRKIM